MNLRPALESEAETIYAIKRDAYAEYATRAYGKWNESFQREFTRGLLPVARMIEVEGSIVGWVAVKKLPGEDEIVDLHILPAFQRRGIGTIVVRQVLNESREQRVVLRVLKINPARSLYERLGFVSSGETETHVVMSRRAQPAGPDHRR